MKKTVNKAAKEITVQQYKRGDEFQFGAKEVTVVEVIYEDHYHLKNKNKPFDSFIATGAEIAAQKDLKEAIEDHVAGYEEDQVAAGNIKEDQVAAGNIKEDIAEKQSKPDLLYIKDDTLDL